MFVISVSEFDPVQRKFQLYIQVFLLFFKKYWLLWSFEANNLKKLLFVNWPEQFEKVCDVICIENMFDSKKVFFYWGIFRNKTIFHILKCIGSKVNIAGKIQYSQNRRLYWVKTPMKTLWKKCHMKKYSKRGGE